MLKIKIEITNINELILFLYIEYWLAFYGK